jgi:hypothetical protein
VTPDVKTGDDRADGGAREIHYTGNVSRDLDVDLLTSALFRIGNDTFSKTDVRRPRYSRNRFKQRHKCCQIVGLHVEHRPAADLVEEVGIRVPAIGTTTGHERRSHYRLSDPAIIDELAACLKITAEKGIRSTSRPETFLFRKFRNGKTIRLLNGKGLLRIGVFPSFKNLLVDERVDLRHHQVNQNLNIRIGEDLVDRTPADDLKLLRSLLCESTSRSAQAARSKFSNALHPSKYCSLMFPHPIKPTFTLSATCEAPVYQEGITFLYCFGHVRSTTIQFNNPPIHVVPACVHQALEIGDAFP